MRQAASADARLAQLEAAHQAQLAVEMARADAAAVAAKEADAVWQEVLMQTEEEVEARAEADGTKLAATQRSAEEVCMQGCAACGELQDFTFAFPHST